VILDLPPGGDILSDSFTRRLLQKPSEGEPGEQKSQEHPQQSFKSLVLQRIESISGSSSNRKGTEPELLNRHDNMKKVDGVLWAMRNRQ